MDPPPSTPKGGRHWADRSNMGGACIFIHLIKCLLAPTLLQFVSKSATPLYYCLCRVHTIVRNILCKEQNLMVPKEIMQNV